MCKKCGCQDKNCKGCKGYEDTKNSTSSLNCGLVDYPWQMKICPCKLCLVKNICETPCEKFDNLFSE